jgi:hypothetical protein
VCVGVCVCVCVCARIVFVNMCVLGKGVGGNIKAGVGGGWGGRLTPEDFSLTTFSKRATPL